MLASSSHDASIHIRRIRIEEKQEDIKAALGVQELIMFAEEKRFCITMYSVLYGHDQWVYSLQWKHFDQGIMSNNNLFLIKDAIHCFIWLS